MKLYKDHDGVYRTWHSSKKNEAIQKRKRPFKTFFYNIKMWYRRNDAEIELAAGLILAPIVIAAIVYFIYYFTK